MIQSSDEKHPKCRIANGFIEFLIIWLEYHIRVMPDSKLPRTGEFRKAQQRIC